MSNSRCMHMNYPLVDVSDIVETVGHKCKCDLCKTDTEKTLRVITNENDMYELCHLCRSIVVFNKSEAYRTIYIKSKIPQDEVIRETIKYYLETGSIPPPAKIDKHAKRLNVSSPLLKMLMCKNNKIKKKMEKKGIVSFINPEYNLEKIFVRNIFSQLSDSSSGGEKINDYWTSIAKMKIYDIEKSVDIKVKKTLKKMDETVNNTILESMKKLQDRKNETIEYVIDTK